jgi:hypothetical protein
MELKLARDKVALVDKRDYPLVSQYLWYVRKDGYVQSLVDGKYWLLHRFILEVTDRWILTDHRNLNRLDCRRQNLRIATPTQNSQNRAKTGKQRYKGVQLTQSGLWRAQIQIDGIKTHLGVFSTDTEAANAYDVAALQHFGQFARTNY